MTDLNGREIGLLVPLALLMVVLGVAPNAFLKMSEPAVNDLLETVERKLALAESESIAPLAFRTPEAPVDNATDENAVDESAVENAIAELPGTLEESN